MLWKMKEFYNFLIFLPVLACLVISLVEGLGIDILPRAYVVNSFQLVE